MFHCDADHVVPDTTCMVHLNEHKTHKKAPKRFQASTKLNEYNDFFNLYNDTLCTGSPSSCCSSGDEACVVPSSDHLTKVSADRNYEDSMTFNFCIDDRESVNVSDLDSLERVVIGCEGEGLSKIRHNRHARRKTVKRRHRNQRVGQPLASSTVIGSPLQLQQPTKLKQKLSRKDSGICESVTSLHTSGTSCCDEISRDSINDRTFVIKGQLGIKMDEENKELIGNREGPVGSSTEFLDKVGVNNNNNKYKGLEKCVPRTSTKARLRLTPERTEKTRLVRPYHTPSAQAVCSLPFAKILRMFRKKRKTGEQILKGNDSTCFNMTRQEKKDILNRMKHFKDSYKNNTNDSSIRTLADL